ncbi:MAG: flavodoxin [Lachnospiraceae bacterium]|nr:flavodoxin [Lachnospiraceae bacterium]
MKDLVVYYSLEGNTAYVAEIISKKTGADLLRLEPKKAYHDKGFAKFLWGGKSAVMAEKPELEDYDVNLDDYDRIIFGFPVWASNYTPPIRTFIEENADVLAGKRFAAYACQSGSGGKKALGKLAKDLCIEAFEQTGVFNDPKAKKSRQTHEQIKEFLEGLLGKA